MEIRDLALPRLCREFTLVRKRGFTINDQRTEIGLTAVAVAIRDLAGSPVAAVAIAMPSARFHLDRIPARVSGPHASTSTIERTLA